MAKVVFPAFLVAKYVQNEESQGSILICPLHPRVNAVNLPSQPLLDHLVTQASKVSRVNEVTMDSLDNVRAERMS